MVRWIFIGLAFVAFHSSFGDCVSAFTALTEAERDVVHGAIAEDLFRGEITQAQITRMNQNAHDLWFVEVHNPSTNRTRKAVMKPREWGDHDGWGRSPMEFVAYRLNRMLGMDYVPPTVYRRGLKIKSHWIHEAPLIHLVPNAQVLYETPENLWGLSKEAIQSDHRILNVLLHNSDGHYKNLLLGTHWVENGLRPVFIDFGASFRGGTQVTMRKYPAFRNSEPVSKIRAPTLSALKNLSREKLQELNEFLSEEEISALLQRRDGIVSYFEKLIEENGYQSVVL